MQLPPADSGHVLQLSDFRRVQVGRGVQAIRVYTGNTRKFDFDGFGKTFLGLVSNLRAPGQQHVDILWRCFQQLHKQTWFGVFIFFDKEL